MQGLDNTQLLPYAELSGLYSLTNITVNGFSTYQHETHPAQFFYNSTLKSLSARSGTVAGTNQRKTAEHQRSVSVQQCHHLVACLPTSHKEVDTLLFIIIVIVVIMVH